MIKKYIAELLSNHIEMCKEKKYIYDIELELMAVTYSSLSFLVLNSWFLLALSYFYNASHWGKKTSSFF
jgi:hypothetical protein